MRAVRRYGVDPVPSDWPEKVQVNLRKMADHIRQADDLADKLKRAHYLQLRKCVEGVVQPVTLADQERVDRITNGLMRDARLAAENGKH